MRRGTDAPKLAEVTTALTDGLRAVHAEGRSSLSSGEGLRRVVAAIIQAAQEASRPVRTPAGSRTSGSRRGPDGRANP